MVAAIGGGSRGVCVFQPSSKSQLQIAVNAWVGGERVTYGSDINLWDVSLVTYLSDLFRDKTTFNDDISNWDVSSVTNMRYMFRSASAFNQDISSWDVSSVTEMYGMFNTASAFDQDISAWDMSSVTIVGSMFASAVSFDQEMCWDLSVSSPHSFIHQGPRHSLYNSSTSSCGCGSGRVVAAIGGGARGCLLYTSPSPRD